MGRDLKYKYDDGAPSGLAESIHLLHPIKKCTFCLPWLNEADEALSPERVVEDGETEKASESVVGETPDLPLVYLRFENQVSLHVAEQKHSMKLE